MVAVILFNKIINWFEQKQSIPRDIGPLISSKYFVPFKLYISFMTFFKSNSYPKTHSKHVLLHHFVNLNTNSLTLTPIQFQPITQSGLYARKVGRLKFALVVRHLQFISVSLVYNHQAFKKIKALHIANQEHRVCVLLGKISNLNTCRSKTPSICLALDHYALRKSASWRFF